MNSASFLVYSEFSGTCAPANYINTPFMSLSPKNIYESPEVEFLTLSKSTNEKYSLKKPLVALISKSENEYKIEYPQLELYAFNKNKDEVINEFLNDFFDLCDDILFLNDSDLGKYPKYWKEVLFTLVKENGKN